MNSFQMASYTIKRCSLSTQSLVIFLLLVGCLEKRFEVSSESTPTEASTNTTGVTTPQPVQLANNDTSPTATTTTTKAPFNGSCTTNETCAVGFCDNQLCKCNNEQYYNGSSCVNKPNHEQFCNHTVENVCLNPANKCIQEKNNTYYCLCNSSYFWYNNTCQPVSLLQVSISASTSTENSINITWTSVGYLQTGDYYKISYNSPKVEVQTSAPNVKIDGLIAGTNYTITITTVLDGSVLYNERNYSTSTIIRTKSSYDGNCRNDNDCVEGTTCIKDNTVSLCLCKDDEYRSDDGKCLPVQAVVNLKSSKREPTTLYFTWDAVNPNTSKAKYYIYANEKNSVANATNGSVSDLTPGSSYLVYVLTVINDTHKEKKLNSSGTFWWTFPAQPGEVTSVFLLENTNNTYNISFGGSQGKVARYIITVREKYPAAILEEQTSTTTSATFMKLMPGQIYTYSIIAINNINDTSESRNGSLSTSATAPGPVSDLQVPPNAITVSSALITWKKPITPNGNLTGYVVFVEQNSVCEWPYIIMCDDSVTNITNECSKADWNYVKGFTCDQFFNSTFLVELNVTNLVPYKTYNVKVAAINEKGNGTVNSREFKTKVGAPSKVNITVLRTNLSNNIGLNINWTPGNETGPTNYTICLAEKLSLNVDNYGDSFCNDTIGYHSTSFNYSGLLGYWEYKINVTAITDVGTATSDVTSIQTLTSAPGAPSFDLKQDTTIAKMIWINITCPSERSRNGIIEKYTIEYKIEGPDNPKRFNETANCALSPERFKITNVDVEKNYSVQVSSINQNHVGNLSNPKFIEVKPKAPFPDKVNKSLTQDTSIQAVDEVGVLVCPTCIKDDSQGTVISSGLIICASTECTTKGRRKRSADEFTTYSNFTTWSMASKGGFKQAYRTTPGDWLLDKDQNFIYKIGEMKSCSAETKDFCNGPLPEDRKIEVKIFVCTAGGCLTAYIIGKTKASDRDPVPAIVGGVVGGILGLALIAAVVGLFIWYKRRPKRPQSSSPFWDMDSQSRKREHIKEQRPIKIYEFKDHVIRLHKDSNLLFQDEFEDIKKLSAKFPHTSEKAKEESNRVKNRYVDILPYDHSRVKLDIQPEDDDSMDFINANFIPGYNSVREYIATQGPMHYTIPDFWRMTWEQKSKVIVMLSDLQEQGKRKVDLYWPENLNEPINYGNIIVEMTNFSQLNKYIIRNFKISRGSDTRRVTHFFLPGWWDFSANLTTEDVLEFAKLVRQEATPANSGPIIVHCSAGVGRTGTFIALDYFMQYIEKHSLMDSVDIFSYVMKMRYNRPRMVQAETQYIFIFDALEEIITKKIKDEEEKMAEHTYGNGNIYANVTVKQPEDSIYANSEPVKDKNDKNAYDNQAFEMEYQNMDLNQSKKDNPTTVL